MRCGTGRSQPRLVLDALGADVGASAGCNADLAGFQDDGNPAIALRPDLGQESCAHPAGRDVSVSWNLDAGRFSLDLTVPEGTEADVIVAAKTVRVKAGRHHLESDRPTRTEFRAGTESGHALLCNRKVDCLNDTGALN